MHKGDPGVLGLRECLVQKLALEVPYSVPYDILASAEFIPF